MDDRPVRLASARAAGQILVWHVLWHWPLYLLLQLMLPGYRGSGLWVVQALTLLLSLVMTAVSWWMVENPVAEWIKSKRDKSAPRRTVAQRSAPRRVGSARARGVYGTHLNNVEFTQPYSQAAPCPRRKTRRSSHPAAPVPRRRCAWSSPCRLWY